MGIPFYLFISLLTIFLLRPEEPPGVSGGQLSCGWLEGVFILPQRLFTDTCHPQIFERPAAGRELSIACISQQPVVSPT